MHSKHPEMAKRWEAETPEGKKLPDRVGSTKRSKRTKSAKDIAPHLVNRRA